MRSRRTTAVTRSHARIPVFRAPDCPRTSRAGSRCRSTARSRSAGARARSVHNSPTTTRSAASSHSRTASRARARSDAVGRRPASDRAVPRELVGGLVTRWLVSLRSRRACALADRRRRDARCGRRDHPRARPDHGRRARMDRRRRSRTRSRSLHHAHRSVPPSRSWSPDAEPLPRVDGM